MKKLFVVVAVTLLSAVALAITLFAGPRDGSPAVRDRFVGAWRLVSLEEPGADGSIHKAECTGLLVYTADGYMSVQVMYRNPQLSTNVAPVQYSQGGYEASFGRYEIDDSRTFTFHVEGALVRTLIGKDLKRLYEFSGNQLIVKSPDSNEHWRVAWERY
ncbi:MAG TPA: lipocalin-like domain-containing protein [Candidatus Sulfotelmatobacter sp.]|nr:lipocalin-like domain-containing protein [Candidatus Sulfotelmatobacter sp.]